MGIIHFQYAFLSKGKSWEVVFWQSNPFKGGELERVRIRINRIPEVNRERYGLRLCEEINKKLDRGEWNYFTEKHRSITFPDAWRDYLEGRNLRPASLASYRSIFAQFEDWLKQAYPKHLYIHQITPEIAKKYFALVLVKQRRYQAKTYNNVLVILRQLWNSFMKEGYVKDSPFTAVQKMIEDEKFGVIIPRSDLAKLWAYLSDQMPGFFVVCGLCYYGLVRRSEITRMQFYHIDWAARVIRLPGTLTKNRKNKIVVIPDEFYAYLVSHGYDKMPGAWYVASHYRTAAPGEKKCAASRISEIWRRVARKLEFPDAYEFYSLKDTGNTHMEEAGISSPAIRDQAGWKYLQQRNTYSHTTGESLDKLRKFKSGDFL